MTTTERLFTTSVGVAQPSSRATKLAYVLLAAMLLVVSVAWLGAARADSTPGTPTRWSPYDWSKSHVGNYTSDSGYPALR